MYDALAARTLHFGLRSLQSLSRRRLVAARDRGFHLLDKGAHARFPRLVPRGAGHGLSDAFTRG